MKVGVIGAGQLGRMIALAGIPLDIQFCFLDPAPNSPAGQFCEHILSPFDDLDGLTHLVKSCDVVTYEFENVPVEAAEFLAQRVTLSPPPNALAVAQDRLSEKTLFVQQGMEVPPFRKVDTLEELESAVKDLGLPAVLKTRRMGYDGKGQAVLRSPEDVETAWEQLQGVPLILEGFVHFERELSLIGVRDADGNTVFYPLVQNTHREGILRLTLAPAPNVSSSLQESAEKLMKGLMDTLNYVGVLTVELFEVGGKLLANEMAPRVHNSGHWTIEGAETSQFENHLRAICGLPLGGTAVRGSIAMLNLIGEAPAHSDVMTFPETHLHLYGKSPRPGRKIGHITLLATDDRERAERVRRLERLIGV
ncbi:MAG: 5-(carboxyamino)imidazole ribonucleotide synthase [Armatimonadetes bacterium]|nr:5-(carboxyamino)imidazole ribonucleotide synthase [Armatimonadota bacterium]